MPRMHAITLLATGGMAGTIVGYLIARYSPQFWLEQPSPSLNPKDRSDTGKFRHFLFKSLFTRGKGTPETKSQSSGNLAFDTYRSEALQRLEEEQIAFAEYLNKLKTAKDQEEFDAFLARKQNHA